LNQSAIWVASFPKSGNIWIRVCTHNILHQLQGDESHCHDINSIHELTERESIIGRLESVLGKPAAEATPAQIAAARCAVQAGLVRGQGEAVFKKTHNPKSGSWPKVEPLIFAGSQPLVGAQAELRRSGG
jgi:hypothetical protein